MLPKKIAPTLDDMIAILKVIFVEEGLIKDITTDTSSMDYGFPAMTMKCFDLNSDTNEIEVDGDKLVSVEEDTSRTISILQSSLEDLNEEFEKVSLLFVLQIINAIPHHNRGIRSELCYVSSSPALLLSCTIFLLRSPLTVPYPLYTLCSLRRRMKA